MSMLEYGFEPCQKYW